MKKTYLSEFLGYLSGFVMTLIFFLNPIVNLILFAIIGFFRNKFKENIFFKTSFIAIGFSYIVLLIIVIFIFSENIFFKL